MPKHRHSRIAYSLPCSEILCDTSTMHPRPFLPVSVRQEIFNQLHSLSHPGIKASQKFIKSRYMWPNMDVDIKGWYKECTDCQRAKIGRHTKSAVQPFYPPVSNRFEAVHVDIVGPLPPASTFNSSYPTDARYLVTFINRATRWCEVQPVPNIEAETIAKIWCPFISHN